MALVGLQAAQVSCFLPQLSGGAAEWLRAASRTASHVCSAKGKSWAKAGRLWWHRTRVKEHKLATC